jgi:hypothetical protein
MKRIMMLLCVLCVALASYPLDVRQQTVNRIKKSRAFLYSDVTMKTREEAASQAYDQIQREILNWAQQRTKKEITNISPAELNSVIDTMCLQRADMHRVVAYVRKNRLAAAFSDWNLKLDDDLDTDINNPSVKIENQPKDTILKVEENIDSIDTVKVDTVAPTKESVANQEIRTLLKNNFLGRKGGVIEQIKKAKNFFELKKIMEPLKQKGDILDYGKYATAKSPEDCYLIVYDPAGNIKAILDKGDKVRQNLNTGKEDSIKNYRGCGAIWFIIKD